MFRNCFLIHKRGLITAQKVGKIKQDNVCQSTLICVKCHTRVRYNSPYTPPWVSPALEHSFWQVCPRELKKNRQLVQKDTIFLLFLSSAASFSRFWLLRSQGIFRAQSRTWFLPGSHPFSLQPEWSLPSHYQKVKNGGRFKRNFIWSSTYYFSLWHPWLYTRWVTSPTVIKKRESMPTIRKGLETFRSSSP